jgi:isochorismate pyruvate lyase
MVEPEECRTMADVRRGVDAIDEQIVALLAKRFRFMDAAARIKPSREKIRDEARIAEVIDRVRRAARTAAIPEDLIAAIYRQLIEGSIAYELEKFEQRPLA